jgi:polysaccharide export outer membrane protein
MSYAKVSIHSALSAFLFHVGSNKIVSKIIMNISISSRLIKTIAMLFLISACGVSGEVVKVTTVQKGSYAGLKKEDMAKLDEIKKARGDKGIDESLKTVIEETRHFSIAEYLLQHPEARGLVGSDYRVGGYDVISITVYEEEDLSREAVRVSADGYISFPLIGRIKVDNLTTSKIEKLISRKLAEEQYLLDAHISVMVTGYNSKRFLVLGAAKNPGSYSLQAKERVLDAISRAGGIWRGDVYYHEQAGKKGMIIRTEYPNTYKERKIVINFDLQGLLKGRDQISNIFMADKDVLFIPTAEHFYIIGQVNKPGSYTITDKEVTLVEAISMAGGFTRIAARNRTRIIRVEDGVEKIIEIKVDAITKAGKKIQDVPIKPGDVIVVPESFF